MLLPLLVFYESNFGKSICKKSTLQSAGGHNAQYKGETNDPVRHENAKGSKVSEIQDNIFQPYKGRTCSCPSSKCRLLQTFGRKGQKKLRKRETRLLHFSH